eukprot:s23_g64.t1
MRETSFRVAAGMFVLERLPGDSLVLICFSLECVRYGRRKPQSVSFEGRSFRCLLIKRARRQELRSALQD